MHPHLLGWIVIGLIAAWISGGVTRGAFRTKSRCVWQMGCRGKAPFAFFRWACVCISEGPARRTERHLSRHISRAETHQSHGSNSKQDCESPHRDDSCVRRIRITPRWSLTRKQLSAVCNNLPVSRQTADVVCAVSSGGCAWMTMYSETSPLPAFTAGILSISGRLGRCTVRASLDL